MTIRGKVAAVAAPEAAAVAHRRRPPAADPRVSAPGSRAARDREAVEALKARRPAESSESSTPDDDDSSSLDAVHTGGGFVLGFIAWVVFVNYMQGGTPQVKKLAAAKFLNRTGAAK